MKKFISRALLISSVVIGAASLGMWGWFEITHLKYRKWYLFIHFWKEWLPIFGMTCLAVILFSIWMSIKDD